MSTPELKLELFRQIDTLDNASLHKMYKMVMDFMREEQHSVATEELSTYQKQGIVDAIDDLDAGNGSAHEEVIKKMLLKYNV